MRRADVLVLASVAALIAAPSCSEATGPEEAVSPPLADPAGAPPGTVPHRVEGRVVETMNASGYTYIQVDTGEEKIWAAAPQMEVEVGNEVAFSGGTPMVNFRSNTLDRSFELIHFVGVVEVEGVVATDARTPGTSAPQPEVDLSGIEKAEGGNTVGELYGAAAGLSGQRVTLRGKVVKFTPGVMGKNWMHLRDGTAGPDGSNDVTVTTDGEAKVGDVVVVSGTVITDRDFGFGYRYDLLIEDASVVPE